MRNHSPIRAFFQFVDPNYTVPDLIPSVRAMFSDIPLLVCEAKRIPSFYLNCFLNIFSIAYQKRSDAYYAPFFQSELLLEKS